MEEGDIEKCFRWCNNALRLVLKIGVFMQKAEGLESATAALNMCALPE